MRLGGCLYPQSGITATHTASLSLGVLILTLTLISERGLKSLTFSLDGERSQDLEVDKSEFIKT